MTESKNNLGIFGGLSEVKMNELRKMIIGLDTEDLRRLATLINDPEAFAEEISDLLPHSIKVLLNKGKINHNDLIPIVEVALQDSIRRDPHTIADILFPIFGPAIRKAVAENLKTMVESLNSTLENGFSPQRMGWKFKSIFSGKSYAEIVLSHAYIFRVKQVFLIHKDTGLLLNSATDNEGADTADADMVSSMLSAIKDFVQDSFKIEKSNTLNTIQVGEFNIWIEQGPSAIVAAIVEGQAPSSLRNNLKETVENIHLKHSYELEKFNGEVEGFKKTDPQLNSCIISKQKEKKKRKPLAAVLFFIVLLGILGYWTYTIIDRTIRVSDLCDALNNEAGILITETERSNGKTVFVGLKDPNSTDPMTISKQFKFDESEIEFKLKSYISLETNMIVKRAYFILNPPSTVRLSYFNGTLFAAGEAEESWVELAMDNYISIPGVKKFDKTALYILTNKEKVYRRALSIEEYYFVFKYLKVELNRDQKIKFSNLIEEVNEVLDFNFSQDSVPVIVVRAHTSYEGNPEANKKTAFDRAQQFINLMIDAGIPMEVLVPKTDYIEDIEEDFPVRSVSFKVIYSKPEDL